MTTSAPSPWIEPRAGRAISLRMSRWCASLAVSVIALVLAIRTLPLGSPALLVGSTMPAASAPVLGLLAMAVLVALRGRTRLA